MKIKDLYERVRDGKIKSDIDLQREIIYNPDKQKLVIDSIVKGIPLPAFYFWQREDGVLEVLDGKQRIHAICQFYNNYIECDGQLWKQCDEAFQKCVNQTEIREIVCSGTEELKREIFNRINTLGVPLSKFEVLNGLYHGEYLRGLSAYVKQDRDILKIFGTNNRGNNQMRILSWLCFIKNLKSINDYVADSKDLSFDADQQLIGKYVKFIVAVFEKYGELDIYFHLSTKYLSDKVIWQQNKTEINRRIADYLKDRQRLAMTDRATEIESIIQAVVNNISTDPKRLFTIDDKDSLLLGRVVEDNKYRCEVCTQLFSKSELEIDHILAWSKGGRTVLSNAQLLCRACNRRKLNK